MYVEKDPFCIFKKRRTTLKASTAYILRSSCVFLYPMNRPRRLTWTPLVPILILPSKCSTLLNSRKHDDKGHVITYGFSSTDFNLVDMRMLSKCKDPKSYAVSSVPTTEAENNPQRKIAAGFQ